MLVINTNNHPVSVQIDTVHGPDAVHIQAKGRVNLGEDQKVNANWAAVHGQGVRITPDATPAVQPKAVSPVPFTPED